MSILNFLMLAAILAATAEKIRYLSTEYPKIPYCNPKYISYMNMTSRRYSRNDPRYYVNVHFHTLTPIHNNLTVEFYFTEFLSYNRYKRGFLSMHFQFCDLIHKDLFFGRAMRQGKLQQPCPYPPGDYHLCNMSIPLDQIPEDFPVFKGRIVCNGTSRDTHEPVFYGYIEMEIKTARLRNNKEN